MITPMKKDCSHRWRHRRRHRKLLLGKSRLQRQRVRQQYRPSNSRSGRIICPWLSRRRNKMWPASSRGAAFYDKLIADLASDGLETDAYARCGALILGQSVEYLQEVHDRALERREHEHL